MTKVQNITLTGRVVYQRIITGMRSQVSPQTTIHRPVAPLLTQSLPLTGSHHSTQTDRTAPLVRRYTPASPFQIFFAIWILCQVQWVIAVVSIWFRGAAQLHDPKRRANTLLWRLVLATDGTALGIMLTVGVAVPMGLLMAYLTATTRNVALTRATLVFVVIASICLSVRRVRCSSGIHCAGRGT